MLRANSKLSQQLNVAQKDFLKFAAGAIQRLLPHIKISAWQERPWEPTRTGWVDNARKEVRIIIAVGAEQHIYKRSLSAIVSRRTAVGRAQTRDTLDLREYDICQLIANRIDEVLQQQIFDLNSASLQAISDSFDEYVVAAHIQTHHGLESPIAPVLSALHTLSEQSYENKALSFGCILDPTWIGAADGSSLSEFLRSKKYKALSDGFRTAYTVSTDGKVMDFVDLDKYETKPLTEKHYYPDWTEAIARSSRAKRCGIALSRQGDILVFDEGTLRFTYRYGQWQYWNHGHLLYLLKDQARAQRVPPNLVGRVVGAIYRAALDVSFRRSGGLFVTLHNRNYIRKVVKDGDAIGDDKRGVTDREFDGFINKRDIQSLPRIIAVELASLDGAVVLNNSGRILAYGAVLQPKKSGKLRGTEGSRTKAAIGASNYGLAVKISADGEICIYNNGSEFIRV